MAFHFNFHLVQLSSLMNLLELFPMGFAQGSFLLTICPDYYQTKLKSELIMLEDQDPRSISRHFALLSFPRFILLNNVADCPLQC